MLPSTTNSRGGGSKSRGRGGARPNKRRNESSKKLQSSHDNKQGPPRSRDNNEKPKSWTVDEEDPTLILPQPAFSDDDDEDRYRDMKYKKRLKDFVADQEEKKKAALAADAQAKDELEFDDRVGLEGRDKVEEPEEKPVIERDFSKDAIIFNYETGKLEMRHPIKPRWFVDYNLFRPDDTVVLNGKRRTGKSFMMRKILYEMRHCFWGGLVFSATKHNGFWQQMVPSRYIHETLDTAVIDNLLTLRAATIDALRLRFGPQYKDELYYFVILDDMVRRS